MANQKKNLPRPRLRKLWAEKSVQAESTHNAGRLKRSLCPVPLLYAMSWTPAEADNLIFPFGSVQQRGVSSAYTIQTISPHQGPLMIKIKK